MDARVKPAHDERIVFVTAPALQRTASQELRAALRPGHGVYPALDSWLGAGITTIGGLALRPSTWKPATRL